MTYIIRTYNNEDLHKIQKLYKFMLSKTTYFIRDKSFLKYLMKYPGVNKNGIFVSEEDGDITGFAIVSISDEGDIKIGSIIEFIVKDIKTALAMLKTIENYCKRKNVDVIMSSTVPNLPRSLNGWYKVNAGVIIAKPIKIDSLLEKVIDKTKLISSFKNSIKKVILNIDNKLVEINFATKPVKIRKINKVEEDTLMITTSSQELIQIIFNKKNPMLSLLFGKVRVNRIKNSFHVLKILSMLRIMAPIYLSLSDNV
ncbi:MAG: hypothetical protein ACTSUX_03010 [Promethearchaeota archaeon]